MSNQITITSHGQSSFWDDATKYASVKNDASFVDEVAYVMVTLHRTGN